MMTSTISSFFHHAMFAAVDHRAGGCDIVPGCYPAASAAAVCANARTAAMSRCT
jgi:hypothetical protein